MQEFQAALQGELRARGLRGARAGDLLRVLTGPGTELGSLEAAEAEEPNDWGSFSKIRIPAKTAATEMPTVRNTFERFR